MTIRDIKAKVNYIKCWLQKFGDRDNETFHTEVTIDDVTWEISMQYNFDDDGYETNPYDWCKNSFKHLLNNTIADRSEKELDEIIKVLKDRKTVW